MRVHATAVSIGGRGLLITGPSGSGKSDLALRLIDRGATLVGDDYVDVIEQSDQWLINRIETISNKLEVRGIGIVETSSIPSAPLCLVLDLDPANPPERLPEPGRNAKWPFPVTCVSLSPFETSAAIKAEQALTLFGLPLEARSR